MQNERSRVEVFLKAGGTIKFECDHLDVEISSEENYPQKIYRFTWENASPRIRYLHLDNIASITEETVYGHTDPASHDQLQGWERQ